MPIESEIPMEIESYQKKVLAGMTLRQLLCLGLAIGLAIVAFFLSVHVFCLSTKAAGRIDIVVVCLPLAVGFIRPEGENFERVLLRTLRHHLSKNRLYYAAEPIPFEATADSKQTKLKRKGGHRHGTNPTACAGEYTHCFRRDKGEKDRRKQTKSRIKAAQKEYRQAAARARREGRIAARA